MLIVLGFVLLLAGIAILFMQLAILMFAYKTPARVVGGYEKTRTKKKHRNGESFEKKKTTLFAVYEYVRRNGETRQTLSSDGGSYVKALQTNETVTVRVWEHTDYDDVYLTSNRSPWWMSLSLMVLGTAIFGVAGYVLATVGFSIISAGFILFGLFIRRFRKNKSANGIAKNKEHHKSFEPSKIQPIESFQ